MKLWQSKQHDTGVKELRSQVKKQIIHECIYTQLIVDKDAQHNSETPLLIILKLRNQTKPN